VQKEADCEGARACRPAQDRPGQARAWPSAFTACPFLGPGGIAQPMVTVQDVVRSVERRGAASFDELERELCEEGQDLLPALDLCVDHGYLRLALRRDASIDAPYRVTARGRRLLLAAARASAAA
jgi:hypothetical protein